MLAGLLSLVIASAFTGTAFYINFAEHPARMKLSPQAALQQWRPSYKRGFAMQASLAFVGSVFAVAAYFLSSDWRWLLGGAFLITNWPYTMLVIMPLNHRLMAMQPDAANIETIQMLRRWNVLHALRTALGGLATGIFVWSLFG